MRRVRTSIASVFFAVTAVALAAGFGRALSATAHGAPIVGSGRVVSRQIPVTSFSQLQVTGPFAVRVSVGPAEGVTVHVDDNLVGLLEVGVRGHTLHVGLKPGSSFSKATLKADVTVRALGGIDASGAATIQLLDEIRSAKLSVTLAQASQLDGRVVTPAARVVLLDASRAAVSGSATILDLTASGTSGLEAKALTVRSLDVDLSGASRAVVTVTNSISAGLSEASSLRYLGSPQVTRRQVTGGSSLAPL
jgi:putative autotransporter adhesin-like protein